MNKFAENFHEMLAFITLLCYNTEDSKSAAVVESADTRDLKSLGSNTVPVQVRSAAPRKAQELRASWAFSFFVK